MSIKAIILKANSYAFWIKHVMSFEARNELLLEQKKQALLAAHWEKDDIDKISYLISRNIDKRSRFFNKIR